MRHRSGPIAFGLLLLTACATSNVGSSTTAGDDGTTTTPLPAVITTEEAPVVQLSDLDHDSWEITGNPDWMIDAFDSLWVKLDFGPVVRIDPDTGEVVAEIDVGGDVCPGLGAAIGVVWTCFRETRDVPPNLVAIDPETNTVMSVLDVTKSLEQSRLVEADDHVWILTPSGDQLVGVDLTGATTEPIDLGLPCSDVAADGETLFVTCVLDGVVLKVDLAGRSVEEVIRLHRARAVAVAEDLWVGFSGGVAQIDPDTNEVIAVYDTPPGSYGWLTVAEDVWVRSGSPLLTRIDPVRQSVVEVIEAPELPGRGGDVLAIDDSIWVSSFDDSVLTRLTPSNP